jgi:hypothetical protein
MIHSAARDAVISGRPSSNSGAAFAVIGIVGMEALVRLYFCVSSNSEAIVELPLLVLGLVAPIAEQI